MPFAAHPAEHRCPKPNRHIPARNQAALLASVALTALALTGCGSGAHAEDRPAEPLAALGSSAALPTAPPQCTSAVARALGEVAEHIYHEISGGRIAQPAVERLASSPALLAAAQAADPAAARAAIVPLLRGQLARVRVSVAGRTLVEYGKANAVAPVSAPLKDARGRTIGTVTAAEQGVFGYAGTVHAITGALVFARAGALALGGSRSPAPVSIPDKGEVSYRGGRYSVYSFPGIGFPRPLLRTFVLVPLPAASACAPTAAQTAADAIGATAVRIYRDEQSGPRTRAVVRDFERSRPFQEAVASGNRAATEAAIVTFFKSTLHVVRVRATLGEQLVADVGGPHVLAPIRGDVRNAGGRIVGHFLLSVQDDMGYLILARRFAGVQAFLYKGSQLVLGSSSPAPPSIPDHGTVVYQGARYQAYTFLAQAFPSEPLRALLLIPPVPGT
jgi:hypothetical protein